MFENSQYLPLNRHPLQFLSNLPVTIVSVSLAFPNTILIAIFLLGLHKKLHYFKPLITLAPKIIKYYFVKNSLKHLIAFTINFIRIFITNFK